MGFKFTFLCDLLSNLEANRTLKASTGAKNRNPDLRTITNWFNNHEKRIHSKDTDRLALLSCLFPEKRVERVYGLQDASLARVIGRCLLLGISRREELERWRVSGGGDLGQCVENVMRQAENHIPDGQEVTVEEIDAALDKIAARCRFSGPRVRRKHAAVDVEAALAPLYRRLSSRDAKWLTRMILKSYYPVVLPVKFILKSFHFLLPHLLLFQDSFEAAFDLLTSTPMSLFPPRPEPGVAKLLGNVALQHLTPRIGIKVGRPEFYKARSIKHCCKMAGRRRMSVERKYDGEYCQVHIDLSKSRDFIQIFSKSGKDSTIDRHGIHKVLKQCLRIGEPDCKFSRRCILEGELLVWSDKDEKILEFHKLRKFISRSGTFIGTQNDSQPRSYEHLMIMFFDVLLIDDDVCLTKPHRERRMILKNTVKQIPGRAGIAEQEIIDFSLPDSQSRLENAFSKSLAERWEGYVLKGCDEPYFSILSSETDECFGRWIKLKKDYIPGLGDTADFALIGGRYDPKDAAALKDVGRLSWTHFHVGCLENKDAVTHFSAKPSFRVVDVIGRQSLNARNIQLLNQLGQFRACDPDSNTAFDVHGRHTNLPSMDVVFETPFVVEMLGSGFEKPSDARFYTLRFPRVLKIHWERTFEEAISFSELQDLAEKARSVPEEELCEERISWAARLKALNGGSEYIVDRSQSISQTTSPTSSSAPSFERSSSQTAGSQSPIAQGSSAKVISDTDYALSIPHAETLAVHSPPRPSGKRKLPRYPGEDLHGLDSHKKVKGSNASEPPIAIFIDNTQSSSPQIPYPPNRFLTDIRNTTSRRDVPHLDMARPRDRLAAPSVQDENCGQHAPDSTAAQQQKEHETKYTQGSSEIEQGSNNAQEPEGKNVETNDASIIMYSPEPTKITLLSPLVTLPVYLGQFFWRKSSILETFFKRHAREFTFASCHFVEELSFPTSRDALRQSNPGAVSHDIALGIVLVDLTDLLEVVRDLREVGNEVAKSLTSNWPLLPPRGKIFFLDYRVLVVGTGVEDRRFCLRKTWTRLAEKYYYGCVVWGYGLSPEEQAQRDTAAAEAERRKLEDDMYSPEDKRIGTDVTTRFGHEELETLGEFRSLDPLVHINGKLYEENLRFI